MIEWVKTPKKIKELKTCNSCPVRLYNDINSEVNLYVGNPYSKIMVVLGYNYNKDLINIPIENLKKLYEEIIGKPFFENTYITYAVKCSCCPDKEMSGIGYEHCINFLAWQYNIIKPIKVILTPSAYYYNEFIKKVIPLNKTIKLKYNLYKRFEDLIKEIDSNNFKLMFL